VVGGGLPFDPSFNPRCTGGVWVDPRPGTNSQASWVASASFGALAASATSALSNLPPLGTTIPLAYGVSASSLALAWNDLTITAPGLTGQRGRIGGSIRIDGHMDTAVSSVVASGRSSGSFEVQVIQNGRRPGGSSIGGVLLTSNGVVTGNPATNEVLGFSAEVAFGTPFLLEMRLNTAATAIMRPEGSPGSPEYLRPVTATAASNFGNTALWNGLQSVTLLDGTAVGGWNVASASGLDYSLAMPVPEPSTWAMFALGLGTLLATGRRRKQR